MIRYPVIRQLFAATLIIAAVRVFLFGKETGDVWFFIAACAFALGSIGITAQILLTYRSDKRQ